MSRRRLLDRAFTAATGASALLALAVLFGLVGFLVVRGARAMSWSFLAEATRAAGAEGGVVYQLLGTVVLVATAAAVAVPVAAGTGLFLESRLAPGRTRRLFEAILQAANGVPSIVFGLVGFALFFHALGWRKSWLAGGLVLGTMIVPTVVISFVEKLRAIPASTLEAARGLGLDRSRVAAGVQLPAAASGLVTGTLLGLARAAGETAPILFTAAVFSGVTLPRGIVDSPVVALPYHIFVLAQDAFDPAALDHAWGAAVVLLLFVVTLSAVALPLRLRIREEARRG